jgi:hypothetical protein
MPSDGQDFVAGFLGRTAGGDVHDALTSEK